jgi:hypothetical protein
MRINIESVEQQDDIWRVAIAVIDGDTTVRYLHTFPTDTMEWRAAEYGIDPSDRATLLDIVLLEPHLSEEERATGHQLHDAPDIPTARRDHLARCARAKLRTGLSTKGSPLDRVRSESVMHDEVIAVKAELVAQARVERRRMATRMAPPVESGAERAERLRRQFFAPPTQKSEGI